MLAIRYCEECCSRLSNYGVVAETIFCEIVDHYIFETEPLKINTSIHLRSRGVMEVINFLESKNLVVTTENGIETIMVKPKGVVCEEEDWGTSCTVCFEQEIHDEID